jgi:hypothetical protein
MSDKMIEQNTSLIDLKALSEPANKLIDSVSSAIGILYEPRRKKRDAKAEIEIKKMKALAHIDLEDEIEQRIIERKYNREIKRQKNIEKITRESLKYLPPSVSEDKVNEDWIHQFFEYSQDISDEKTQGIWAKILAGEVAKPNSFSPRTLDFLKKMSFDEIILFDKLAKLTMRYNQIAFLCLDILSENLREDLTFHELNIFTDSKGDLFDLARQNNKLIVATYAYGEVYFDYRGVNDSRHINLEIKTLNKIGRELLALVEPEENTDVISFLQGKFKTYKGSVKYKKNTEK